LAKTNDYDTGGKVETTATGALRTTLVWPERGAYGGMIAVTHFAGSVLPLFASPFGRRSSNLGARHRLCEINEADPLRNTSARAKHHGK